jgi:hypothetical protein
MNVRIAAAASLFVLGASVTLASAGTPSAGQPDMRQMLPPCASVTATVDSEVDSAKANVGDVFTFTTSAPADAGSTTLPAGLEGYGVVSYVKHAGRARGGELALEARYVVAKDGTKTPATIVASNALARGGNRDLPFVFGATGLFHSAITSAISGVAGFYGLVHRGAEASVGAGSPLKLVLGDGLTERTCSASLVDGPANYRRQK